MAAIRVGCAVLISKDQKLLLGKRGKDPYRGHWVVPGGGVNPFESLFQTAIREMEEETGLEISVIGVSNIAEIIVPGVEHRLVVYVSGEIVGGEPRPGSDMTDVRFFSRLEIQELALRGMLTPTVESALHQSGWLVSRPEDASRSVWQPPPSQQAAE